MTDSVAVHRSVSTVGVWTGKSNNNSVSWTTQIQQTALKSFHFNIIQSFDKNGDVGFIAIAITVRRTEEINESKLLISNSRRFDRSSLFISFSFWKQWNRLCWTNIDRSGTLSRNEQFSCHFSSFLIAGVALIMVRLHKSRPIWTAIVISISIFGWSCRNMFPSLETLISCFLFNFYIFQMIHMRFRMTKNLSWNSAQIIHFITFYISSCVAEEIALFRANGLSFKRFSDQWILARQLNEHEDGVSFKEKIEKKLIQFENLLKSMLNQINRRCGIEMQTKKNLFLIRLRRSIV